MFLDSLQLLWPDVHWLAAMRAVLKAMGPGRYQYGSGWSLEGPREATLRAMEDVRVVSAEQYLVQAVDLARWPDWISYERALSNNVRRNAAKATKTDPGIRIERSHGMPPVRSLLRMVVLNWSLFRRKQLSRFLLSSVQLIGKLPFLQRYYDVAWVVHKGGYSAYALILRFGDHFYYTNGATIKDNGGSAWYLLKEMIRSVKCQSPTGKFVMGFNPIGPEVNPVAWANILRQRVQCRVSNWITSIVVFDVTECGTTVNGGGCASQHLTCSLMAD